jgi:hypothetical protein
MTMKYGVKLPVWLERRGYSPSLKRRLIRAKIEKSRPTEIDRKHSGEPQAVGMAVELQRYLTWRLAQAI